MRQQLDALSRAFLVRFFESELTTGADDLKRSFFWLLAALAVPGMFLPWIMAFSWQLVAMLDGPEALRIVSRAEKTFYLGYSMIASGLLTVIVWGSLLPDRRDTLILGALPVKPTTVVIAKLAALAGYIGLVAVATHAVGAIFWGLILGDRGTLAFSLRGILAHFLASAAASMAVCLAVAAAQGLTLALVGPRLFRRASTVLQVALIALIAACLASLPTLNTAVIATLQGARGQQPWILNMPPVWFLGLYEWLLGNAEPLLVTLAGRATVTTGIAVVATVLVYPLAYRRLMISVVETGSEPRNALARALHAVVVRASGRHPAPRAATEFFTATLARVDRQRFVLAISLGIAFAWSVPSLRTSVPAAVPDPSLLALPIAAMLFVLVGLRVASSLPSDVRASWVFEVHDLSRQHARQSLERTLFLLGVLPPVLISTPLYWNLWGSGNALTHLVVMMALGVAVIELLIWHCEGMPCGQRWTPARMDFGRRWPLHFALFLVLVALVPRLEVLLLGSRVGAALFVSTLLAIAALVRYVSARHQIVPVYEDVDPVSGVLRLN